MEAHGEEIQGSLNKFRKFVGGGILWRCSREMYTCDTWEERRRHEDWPLDLQIPEAKVLMRLVRSQMNDIDDDNGSPKVAPPTEPQRWSDVTDLERIR